MLKSPIFKTQSSSENGLSLEPSIEYPQDPCQNKNDINKNPNNKTHIFTNLKNYLNEFKNRIPLHFFIKHKNQCFGLFSVSNKNMKISKFFRNQSNFPSKYSLLKDQQKLDLNSTFSDANIVSYDELELEFPNEKDIFEKNFIKLISLSKIGKLLKKPKKFSFFYIKKNFQEKP